MKLTNTAVLNAKVQDKPYKMTDGLGLYLLINSAGKYWRMDYRYRRKRKTLALGVYPKTTLKMARDGCNKARKLIDEDIDPGQLRKDAKQELYSEDTFENIAREWHKKYRHTWSAVYALKLMRRFEMYIFPFLGDKPVKSIRALDLLAVLRKTEDQGILVTTHLLRNDCSQVFRYAVVTGKAEYDVSSALKGAVPPVKSRKRSAITDPKEVGGLLRAIEGYNGHFITRCALQLMPLVFLRTVELRFAEWSEIDFEKRLWKIPEEKMKMTRPHLVPLSDQALNILKQIEPYTAHKSKYVFPSLISNQRPMSKNTILAAIRRMGYTKNEMCGHGFRGMASTLLNENSWDSDLIEVQLSHTEGNSSRAAYNHAKYIKQRREMMQWWANELDRLKKLY